MGIGRNDPCPCGSGKKYKNCCDASSGINPATSEFRQLAFLYNNGHFSEAEQFSRKLLVRHPSAGELWKVFGYSLVKQGKDAVGALRKAASLLPADADVLAELGGALSASGQYSQALKCYQFALNMMPGNAQTHNNLATVLQELGRTEEAISHYRTALSIRPDYVDAHYNLGIALRKLGKLVEAVESYRAALRFDWGDADAHYNLGVALQSMGQYRLASDSFRQTLRLEPEHIDAKYNLGLTLQKLGQLDEAIACYRQVIEDKPGHFEAICNLGVSVLGTGQLKEANAYFERALKINPKSPEVNRAYLSSCFYNPDFALERMFDTLTGFAAQMSAGLHKVDLLPHPANFDQNKKLRIGYVSSDFYNHPVGRNILPLIERHDHSKFEVYLYGNMVCHDDMTERFKNVASVWRSILGLTDQEVAEMIRKDRIDILVMLAGRFDNNRPLIAVCRPAPVQVSFHDPATSGLDEMDYLLTDHGLSPCNIKEKFTERLFHLPTFYLHPPMDSAPDVETLPAQERGYVTFCSFNNPAKINERVIRVWANVLHEVEGSHLMLKYKNIFSNISVQRRFTELFQLHGIAPSRLQFIDSDGEDKKHLARYAEVDVALDTFPFTGSTTTFEALWMGVPVVTLLGDHMVARWSGAMLKKLDLHDLIANDESEFVSIARRVAENIDQLAVMRGGLRARVLQSPLCDESGRVRQIERAYRWMWSKYCVESDRH